MINDSIQYGFAFQDDSGDLVSIDSLTRDSSVSHKYFCPHCHSEMYPTFGFKQEHHFRHNGTRCEYSNYLHSLAEGMFKEEYLKCLKNNLPFILEMSNRTTCDRKCQLNTNNQCGKFVDTTTIDLTKKYTDIKLETNVNLVDGSFRRPDILLLSDTGEQLWIEIWVTHETTTEKRNDGNIIELKISSENDLENIRKHKVSKSYNNDKFVCIFNAEFDNDCIVDKMIHNSELCTNYLEQSQVRKRYTKSSFRANRLSKAKKDIDIHDEDFDISSIEWVDLGLSSGTLWAKCNLGLASFNTAINRYSGYLPSKDQARELRDECKRYLDPQTNSIKIIGPNRNYILLSFTEKNVSYWLNEYEDYLKNYGQCFHIGQDTSFFINNKDAMSLLYVRLVKK